MTTKRTTTQEDGSWSEWRRLVLNELNRLNKDIEDVKNATANTNPNSYSNN